MACVYVGWILQPGTFHKYFDTFTSTFRRLCAPDSSHGNPRTGKRRGEEKRRGREKEKGKEEEKEEGKEISSVRKKIVTEVEWGYSAMCAVMA